jgi:hypothetical protein
VKKEMATWHKINVMAAFITSVLKKMCRYDIAYLTFNEAGRRKRKIDLQ